MSKDRISMTKSKRLLTKGKALGSLPVGSTSKGFLRLRPSNITANRAYSQKAYGTLYIAPSIQHKINKSTLKFSTKSTTNPWRCGLLFIKKNSSRQSQNAMTLWLQVQTDSRGDI